jgi:hypothetical protein
MFGYWIVGQLIGGTGAALIVRAVAGRARSAADRAPHCPRCRYDMTGVPSRLCPECGHQAKANSELRRTPRSLRLGLFGAALLSVGALVVAMPMVRTGAGFRYLPRVVQAVAWPFCADEGAIHYFHDSISADLGSAEYADARLGPVEYWLLKQTAQLTVRAFPTERDGGCSFGGIMLDVVVRQADDPVALRLAYVASGVDAWAAAAAGVVLPGESEDDSPSAQGPLPPAVLAAARQATLPEARAALVRAYFTHVGFTEALPHVETFLRDPSDLVADTVGAILTDTGDAGIATLCRALADPNPKVRARAVGWCVERNHRERLVGDGEPLLALLDDPVEGVREAAVDVLSGHWNRSPLLVEGLRAAFDGTSPRAKLAAIDAMARAAGPHHGRIQVLWAKATDEDEDQEVRDAALHAYRFLTSPVTLSGGTASGTGDGEP